MLRIRKRTLATGLYVRTDVPADENRSNAYLPEPDRTLRIGDAMQRVPGWGRVVVVEDPVLHGAVECIPVEARQ